MLESSDEQAEIKSSGEQDENLTGILVKPPPTPMCLRQYVTEGGHCLGEACQSISEILGVSHQSRQIIKTIIKSSIFCYINVKEKNIQHIISVCSWVTWANICMNLTDQRKYIISPESI